jgi:hypothetical protein
MIHTRPRPLCGSLPLHYLLCNRTHPYSVTHLTMAQAIFEPNLLLFATQTILKFGHSSPNSLWRWTDSVPKRRHIKFRRRGITQKKIYHMTQTFVKPLDQVNWCLRLVTVFLGCRHIYPLNRYFRMYNVTICVLPFSFKLTITIMQYKLLQTTIHTLMLYVVLFTLLNKQSLNHALSTILCGV